MMPKCPEISKEHEALAEKTIDETIQQLTDAGLTEFGIGLALGRASGRLQRAAFPDMQHFTEEDLGLMVAVARDENGWATAWTPAVNATLEQIDEEILDLEEHLEDVQIDLDALREMRQAKAPGATN